MLDNQNLSPQQRSMYRTTLATRVVDVVRVDANQFCATVPQVSRSIGCQKRMIFVIGFGIPEFSPARVNQYCPISDFVAVVDAFP